MARGWWIFNNSTNRRDIDAKFQGTILFKTMFPDFAAWQAKLPGQHLDIALFNTLLQMIGNSYLKYTTEEKNLYFLALKFDELDALRVREEMLYNLSLDKLMEAASGNTQRFYQVNRTEDDIVDEKFLNNVVKVEYTSKQPQIGFLKELEAFVAKPKPIITFIKRYANSITHNQQYNNAKEDIFYG